MILDEPVIKNAIDVFGIDRQVDKTIEEMGELIRALMKWKYNNEDNNAFNVAHELADVSITLSQMFYFFNAKYKELPNRIQKSQLSHLKKVIQTSSDVIEDLKYSQD